MYKESLARKRSLLRPVPQNKTRSAALMILNITQQPIILCLIMQHQWRYEWR